MGRWPNLSILSRCLVSPGPVSVLQVITRTTHQLQTFIFSYRGSLPSVIWVLADCAPFHTNSTPNFSFLVSISTGNLPKIVTFIQPFWYFSTYRLKKGFSVCLLNISFDFFTLFFNATTKLSEYSHRPTSYLPYTNIHQKCNVAVLHLALDCSVVGAGNKSRKTVSFERSALPSDNSDRMSQGCALWLNKNVSFGALYCISSQTLNGRLV